MYCGYWLHKESDSQLALSDKLSMIEITMIAEDSLL